MSHVNIVLTSSLNDSTTTEKSTAICVGVRVTLRLPVSQSVSRLWLRDPCGTHDHIVICSRTITVLVVMGRPL